MARIFVSGALYLGVVISIASGQQNCAEEKVRKCIAIAEPMLKDPHLIFPDNMNDINNVCRTWTNFVECIRRYIDKCFSKVRKDQFNSAVEPPISSVHQMCSISSYQSEYLQYAGCIKATVIEPEHCGGHYSFLVAEVSQENVRKPNLCCAYHNFRTCVIQKTRMRCDNNQPEGIAARFSRQVLDKAFRFLQDQCLNYIMHIQLPPNDFLGWKYGKFFYFRPLTPDTGKCTAMMTSNSNPGISRLGEGRSVTLESASANRTGNANHQQRKPPFVDVFRGGGSRDLYDSVTNTAYSSNSDLPRPVTSGPATTYSSSSSTTQKQKPQQPVVKSSVKPEETTSRKTEPTLGDSIVDNSVPIASGTQRSSSYGRGLSWTTPTTPSTSEIPDWATNTWLTHSQDLPTEEIYPAAGSFGGNNIDEPNQQGLSGNSGCTTSIVTTSVFLYIYIIISTVHSLFF